MQPKRCHQKINIDSADNIYIKIRYLCQDCRLDQFFHSLKFFSDIVESRPYKMRWCVYKDLQVNRLVFFWIFVLVKTIC